MIRTGSWIVGVAMVALMAGDAGATVGGGSYFKVLGHDTVDDKVYLLETRWHAAADLPQLYYLALTSDEPKRPIAVESWYEGDDAHNLFGARLKELKARLKPLEAISLAGSEIHSRIEHTAPCHDMQIWIYDCREVRYEIRHGDHAASLQKTTWGFGDLVGLWTVPGFDALLGVFRHRGHTCESGYDMDEIVFLERVQAAAP